MPAVEAPVSMIIMMVIIIVVIKIIMVIIMMISVRTTIITIISSDDHTREPGHRLSSRPRSRQRGAISAVGCHVICLAAARTALNGAAAAALYALQVPAIVRTCSAWS